MAFILALRIVADRMRIDLVQISIMIMCLYLGAGPWIAAIYNDWRLPESNVDSITSAYVGVYAFFFGMIALRTIMGSPKGVDRNYVKLILKSPKHIPLSIWIIWSGSWITRIAMAFDRGDFVSLMARRGDFLPAWIRVGDGIFNWLSFGCVFWALAVLVHSRWKSKAAMVILLTEFTWLFLNGRRYFVGGILALIVTLLVIEGRLAAKQLIWGIAIAGLTFFLVMPLFLGTRAVLHLQSPHASPIERVLGALDDARLSLFEGSLMADGREVEELHLQSMQRRPLVIDFVIEIADGLSLREPMFGRALLYDAGHSFRFFSPKLYLGESKDGESYQSEQNIASHFEFSQSEKDRNSSWVGYGMADFGIYGCLLYGVVYCFLVIVFERIAAYFSRRDAFLAVMSFGAGFYGIMIFDQGPNAIFDSLRALLVCIGMAYVMRIFSHAKSSSGQMRYQPSNRQY